MIRRFARPYAKAILDVVDTPQTAVVLRDELRQFETARAAAKDLQEVYANPAVEMDAKLAITRTIAKKLNLGEFTVRLLDVLVRNHRVNDLSSIIEALTASINQLLGVAVAEVRAAHELTAEQQRELQAMLERKLSRKVELQVSVDPSLLGGFVARIGSEIYDASVVGKIDKFRASLT